MKYKQDEQIIIAQEAFKLFDALGKLGIEQDYTAYIMIHICGTMILDMIGTKCFNAIVRQVKDDHETEPKARTKASKKPSPSAPRKSKGRPRKSAPSVARA